MTPKAHIFSPLSSEYSRFASRSSPPRLPPLQIAQRETGSVPDNEAPVPAMSVLEWSELSTIDQPVPTFVEVGRDPVAVTVRAY
jgi:hypothetical protein